MRADAAPGSIQPNMPVSQTRRKTAFRRNGVYLAGAIASMVCMGFFARQVLAVWESVDVLTQATRLLRLPWSVLLCLLATVAAAFAWRITLGLLDVRLRLSAAAGILFFTQFGKYLPGNIAQHVGRVAVARRFGAPIPAVITSMTVEIVVGAGIMGMLGLPFLIPAFKAWAGWGLAWGAAALMVGGVVLFSRSRLRTVVPALVSRFHAARSPVSWICIALLLSANALLNSFALLVLDPRLLAEVGSGALVVSIFCTAWLAGFVMPGAPAGLGIRELILSAGLTPMIGIEDATASTIFLRMATSAADLVGFVIGLLLLQRVRDDWEDVPVAKGYPTQPSPPKPSAPFR